MQRGQAVGSIAQGIQQGAVVGRDGSIRAGGIGTIEIAQAPGVKQRQADGETRPRLAAPGIQPMRQTNRRKAVECTMRSRSR